MKERILFAILILTSLCADAQVTKEELDKEIKPLTETVKMLQSEKRRLKSEIGILNSKLSSTYESIDSLRTQMKANSKDISKTADELGSRIKETSDKSQGRITEVSESLSRNSLYGIIGVLSAVLITGLLYWLLSKRQKNDKSNVEEQLSKTKRAIEEEQMAINTKMAELYNGQMELLRIERTTRATNVEIDHSLPLKVADEIVKMQMNLIHMDNKVRGHRQLSIAVTNVFDNFKANGYEIIDHLNKPYNDGMNMLATKEPDSTLHEGAQIIRRIIKPEIHYKNKIIQHAQVIVAYN